MECNEKVLEISKLMLELTTVGSTGADLDQLLVRLFGALRSLPELKVRPQGVVLLYNPRGALVQVAQHGLPMDAPEFPASRLLEGVAPEFGDVARVSSLGRERRLAADEPDQSFFIIPLIDDAQPVGLTLLFIDPDWVPDDLATRFMTDLGRALSGLIIRCLVNETLRVRELELEEARTDAIRRLGAASEYRDNETGMHVMRMTHFAVAIAKALGVSEEQRELLGITAPMHDVGKIGIADAILLKPGRLTSDEYDVMKQHTEIGSRILDGDDPLIATARDIALCHHEHWDGSGYPRGLGGESIPLLARICAIADVLDALTSTRPYKEPWPFDEAVAWIRGESGRQFDPAVVAALDEALPQIQRIRELYRDDVIDPNQAIELPPLKPADTCWVRWDDSLSVGIEVIDAHHRFLVDLLNDLHAVVAERKGAREVGRVLKAMEDYTHVHFRAEERMMDRYAFAHLDRQRHQHHRFEEKLREFYSELHVNPLTAPFDILGFLRDWLLHHIRQEDAQLRSLVTSAG